LSAVGKQIHIVNSSVTTVVQLPTEQVIKAKYERIRNERSKTEPVDANERPAGGRIRRSEEPESVFAPPPDRARGLFAKDVARFFYSSMTYTRDGRQRRATLSRPTTARSTGFRAGFLIYRRRRPRNF